MCFFPLVFILDKYRQCIEIVTLLKLAYKNTIFIYSASKIFPRGFFILIIPNNFVKFLFNEILGGINKNLHTFV